MYDALQLKDCDISLESEKKYTPTGQDKDNAVAIKDNWLSDPDISVYVDPAVGNDDNPGTASQPVKTIEEAVRVYRYKKTSKSDQGLINLKAGTYYLTNTINLTSEDSNLVILGDSFDNTFVSGGRQYTLNWKTHVKEMKPLEVDVNLFSDDTEAISKEFKAFGKVISASDCQRACEKDATCFAFTWYDDSFGDLSKMCYFRLDSLWTKTFSKGATSGQRVSIVVADLSSQNPTRFSTLFLNGRRMVRARYPNGNPETMGLHTNPTGYVSSAVKWLPSSSTSGASTIEFDTPQRNGTHFPQFHISYGGAANVFDPHESFFGGGFKTPGGLVYSSSEEFASRTWKNPKTGVVHAFHCGHWGNWLFAVDDRDKENNTITWSYGGFQEARGCGNGAEWFIENIFEELDAPGEWFYDETEMKLYLFPNGTDLPTSGVGTMLHRLFNIQGSMDRPVYNITLMNLTFTQTEPTFFESYEVPSGGDWSIHRGGAVFVEGADSFNIQKCRFDSPGGNALFLSNYVRNAVIEDNEFKYTGDSAIAAVGSVDLIDGTNGNQPRGTKIIGNLIHEIGIYGKQTSAYIQALACQTELTGNVFFNGPRAGINFNDGFGGGNLIKNNLLFNMVRETSDHGPFNSWDRQPYLSRVKDGETPSLTPAVSVITRNFLINNYHSVWPIDHDDGSCYYNDTYNYLVYGGFKNFLGHSKIAMFNAYVYPDFSASFKYCATSDGASRGEYASGWGDVWANNTCIILSPNVYKFPGCNPNGDNEGLIPLTYNNTFYSYNKDMYIQCGKEQLTLSEFQKLGYDVGSVVNGIAENSTVVDWGRELLGL